MISTVKRRGNSVEIRRMERSLRKRFGSLLLLLNGRAKTIFEMRIREVAVSVRFAGLLVTTMIEGRRSHRHYRQRTREVLRPFGPTEEILVDEFVFLLWPRRWERKGETKKWRT